MQCLHCLTAAVNPKDLGLEFHHPFDQRQTKRKHSIVINHRIANAFHSETSGSALTNRPQPAVHRTKCAGQGRRNTVDKETNLCVDKGVQCVKSLNEPASESGIDANCSIALSFSSLRFSGYVGNDYPEIWPIERKTILMTFDNPKHFRLDTDDGRAEWAAIAPGNGVVHLGPHRQPFTVSMMHQLKCLDIIREEMTKNHTEGNASPSELVRHCLNYVRQMVMCHGDLELESFQYASHKDPIDWRGVYECKDWEAVYNEVKRNQEEYGKWTEQHM